MIFAVVGTGTGVGKTTISVSMVEILREHSRVGAWKPIETGGDQDGRALAAASGDDAGPTVLLRDPVAPSVAARAAGRRIDLETLAEEGRRRASRVDHLVVELAGGLYSPLNDEGATNAELATSLQPDALILVAANRLGVLHDVEACRRAMLADGLRVAVVVLTGGDRADASVGTNAAELRQAVEVVEVPSVVATDELRRWLAQRCWLLA